MIYGISNIIKYFYETTINVVITIMVLSILLYIGVYVFGYISIPPKTLPKQEVEL